MLIRLCAATAYWSAVALLWLVLMSVIEVKAAAPVLVVFLVMASVLALNASGPHAHSKDA